MRSVGNSQSPDKMVYLTMARRHMAPRFVCGCPPDGYYDKPWIDQHLRILSSVDIRLVAADHKDIPIVVKNKKSIVRKNRYESKIF